MYFTHYRDDSFSSISYSVYSTVFRFSVLTDCVIIISFWAAFLLGMLSLRLSRPCLPPPSGNLSSSRQFLLFILTTFWSIFLKHNFIYSFAQYHSQTLHWFLISSVTNLNAIVWDISPFVIWLLVFSHWIHSRMLSPNHAEVLRSSNTPLESSLVVPWLMLLPPSGVLSPPPALVNTHYLLRGSLLRSQNWCLLSSSIFVLS